jgi:hypothetical protein
MLLTNLTRIIKVTEKKDVGAGPAVQMEVR